MSAERSQPGVWTLLTPKWRGALARLRQERSGSWAKLLLFLIAGGVFWAAIFGIAFRVLSYIQKVPDIGDLLAGKVLGVILLAFHSILLLSNVITALSTYFLAKDLDLLVAAPVGGFRLYLAKLSETVVHSSWMVALLALPFFTAYGIVYSGGLLFPLVAFAAFLPFLVLPAVIGTIFTVVLVNVFPARRTRELLGLIGLGALVTAVILLRFMRPEQLARPEGFRNFVDYLAELRTPTNPLLPSEWTAEMVMNWLLRVADPWPVLMLWGTALAAITIGALVHRRLYHSGFSKAQEGAARRVRRPLRGPLGRALQSVPAAKREFIFKDLRLFFRDNTQWSQLILLAVLLLIYIFNIKSLPIHSGERIPFSLVIVISFLNLGLAGFVLAAVAARFIFPAVSLEGRQMWLLRSSPLDPGAMLWSKYWTGTVPLLVLALVITVLTNWLLRAGPFMMAVSVGTILLYTLAVCALALSFGVFYPQFGTENAAQIPTSFGGVVYMMASLSLLALVIMLEAPPVASQLRAYRRGQELGLTPQLLVSGAGIVAILVGATILPLRLSVQRIERMEISSGGVE
ncbi:MAG: putative ABC transporter permease subunit [Gemmatimonadales bacterium]